MENDKEKEIELEMYLDQEREKCLKNIQHYYKKYGSDSVTILKEYLLSLCEILTDESEIRDIKKQLDVLELYS